MVLSPDNAVAVMFFPMASWISALPFLRLMLKGAKRWILRLHVTAAGVDQALQVSRKPDSCSVLPLMAEG